MPEDVEQHRNRLRDVRIVIDDEHLVACLACTGRRALTLFADRSRAQRKPDDELAALARPRAAAGNRAPVQLRQSLDQREADAEAALLAIECAIALYEQVEHARHEIGRD